MNISNKPIFIGLAGTLNAGKDSLGEMLAERHGFLHISTSDMIRGLKKDAFGDTPEALLVRNDPFINELRQKNPGFLIDAINKQWNAQRLLYPGGFVASGIRAISEAERIKALGGVIVFVDADIKVRYERSLTRARDKVDQQSFEDFIASEKAEMPSDTTNKFIQNIPAMREMADMVIDNSEHDIEKFKDLSDSTLKKFFQ